MGAVIGWLFSGLWTWILGKLGISPEEKLGREEILNKDLQATLSQLRAEDAAARDTPQGKAETIEALKHGEL